MTPRSNLYTPSPCPLTNKRVLFSAEGIEAVAACWYEGASYPPELQAQSQGNWYTYTGYINYAIFYRPSALTQPGSVAIGDWYGRAGAYGTEEIGSATGKVLSSTDWILGDNGYFENTVS